MSSGSESSPVFVIGCPRSGNTLLGCILNKHPDLVVILENHTFYSLNRLTQKRVRETSCDPIEALVSQFIEGRVNWIQDHTSLELEKDELISSLRKKYGSVQEVDWAELIDTFMRILAERIKPDYKRWGDKTPRNVGDLQSIEQFFPGAQIVYIYRDPRDVVTSLSKESFDHASDDPLTCAQVVRYYWRVYESEKSKIDPQRLYEIRYESLVEQPEQTLRKLCDFLELDFTRDLLQDGDPKLRRRLGWRDYKGWEAIEPQPSSERKTGSKWVEALLADRINQLGYERMYEIDPTTKMLAEAYTAPFRLLRPSLDYMWRQRYPSGSHLLMHELPDGEDFGRWIRQEFSRRFA